VIEDNVVESRCKVLNRFRTCNIETPYMEMWSVKAADFALNYRMMLDDAGEEVAIPPHLLQSGTPRALEVRPAPPHQTRLHAPRIAYWHPTQPTPADTKASRPLVPTNAGALAETPQPRRAVKDIQAELRQAAAGVCARFHCRCPSFRPDAARRVSEPGGTWLV
jgi:hypothetical protein